MEKDNGLIYGVASVTFDGKKIGYIDEQGLQPAGTAPTQQDIYAAQVQDGPVITLTSNPGKKAFTCNLIQLKAEGLKDVIGGTAEADGSWTPPEKWEKTGPMEIECLSGHTIKLFNAKVTGNDFANGLNASNLLAIALNIEVMKGDDGSRLKIIPPATTSGGVTE